MAARSSRSDRRGSQLIRVERHPFGPRCFVFGRRVHECHVGLAMLTVGLAGAAFPAQIPWPALALILLTGTWMLAKDWRDLTRSRRDTTSWRVAIHRRARPLRDARKADWLPSVAG